MSYPVLPPVDERFYPATSVCDWAPLIAHFGTEDPEVIGSWMFMCADLEGWRYYKHSGTRERLCLEPASDEEDKP